MLIDLRLSWRRVRVECFICGCGHSGTTLIANILAGHKDVYMPLKETSIFLCTPDQARVRLKQLRLATRRSAKPVLIEKTPRHIQRLEMIRELSPSAKVLIPIRDGRDVAASYAKRYSDGLDSGIDRWIEENQIAFDVSRQKNILIYRYEDFIDKPTKTLSKICNFVGIEYDRTLLEYHLTPRNWFGEAELRQADPHAHEAFRNWQINQPLFDGRSKWRERHSENEMRRLTTGTGAKLMKAFGYLQDVDDAE